MVRFIKVANPVNGIENKLFIINCYFNGYNFGALKTFYIGLNVRSDRYHYATT